MFTGIIEETGIIKQVVPIAGGKKITISAAKVLENTKVDDSICVNGVCLTVIKMDDNTFTAEAVGETMLKSTLAETFAGNIVNLERAVRLSDRLGGHLVQGHVSGIGTVTKVSHPGENVIVEIELPASCSKYVIDEGSVAVDGISLTIARVNGNKITLSVIPHTWKVTTLNKKTPGSKVNIEIDLIAKYVEKLLFAGKGKTPDSFSKEWFNQLGY